MNKKIKYLFFIGKNKHNMNFFHEFINENKCVVVNELYELFTEFNITKCKF